MVKQATPGTITVGSHVWVEDPYEAWIDGEVLTVSGDKVKIICTSGMTVGTLDPEFYLVFYLLFPRFSSPK